MNVTLRYPIIQSISLSLPTCRCPRCHHGHLAPVWLGRIDQQVGGQVTGRAGCLLPKQCTGHSARHKHAVLHSQQDHTPQAVVTTHTIIIVVHPQHCHSASVLCNRTTPRLFHSAGENNPRLYKPLRSLDLDIVARDNIYSCVQAGESACARY